MDEMTIKDLTISLDTVWVLLAAMLGVIMQAGFGLVDSGVSRP